MTNKAPVGQGIRPIAIYDTGRKKLLAIFHDHNAAHSFVFSSTKERVAEGVRIQRSAARKWRIRPNSSQLPCVVSPRYATPEQIVQLDCAESLLIDPDFAQFITPMRRNIH